MGVSIVQIGDKIELDLTTDTVTPDKLASGVTAHDKTGNKITGTLGCKVYEVTVAKSSGWVLLLTLDNEVLAHINDAIFCACLTLKSEFEYVYYNQTMCCAGNKQLAVHSSYPVYGAGVRLAGSASSPTAYNMAIYYPANNTSTSTSIGNAQFRLSGSKYYFRPSDGFLVGTYALTFTW